MCGFCVRSPSFIIIVGEKVIIFVMHEESANSVREIKKNGTADEREGGNKQASPPKIQNMRRDGVKEIRASSIEAKNQGWKYICKYITRGKGTRKKNNTK